MSHLGDNHLLCVAGEHCRGKLDAKEKAAFSFKYLLVYSFRVKNVYDALYPSVVTNVSRVVSTKELLSM